MRRPIAKGHRGACGAPSVVHPCASPVWRRSKPQPEQCSTASGDHGAKRDSARKRLTMKPAVRRVDSTGIKRKGSWR